METFIPQDCWKTIFGYLTSYQRVLPCLVSRSWCNVIIGMIPGYRSVHDMVANGDYLAMMRLKNVEAINIQYAYESGDPDMIAFVQTWFNEGHCRLVGSVRGAIIGGRLELAKKLDTYDFSINTTDAFKLAYNSYIRTPGLRKARYEIVKYFLDNYPLDSLDIGCEGFNLDVWTLEDGDLVDLIQGYIVCENVTDNEDGDCYPCDNCTSNLCEVLARRNDWDKIKQCIQAANNDGSDIYQSLFSGAYWGGHRDLIEKLTKLAPEFEHEYIDDNYLCQHPDILREHYTKYQIMNLYETLQWACMASYEAVCIICEAFERELDADESLADDYRDRQFNAVLEEACKSGDIRIVKRVAETMLKIDYCVDNSEPVNCYGMYEACFILHDLGLLPADNTGSYQILQFSKKYEQDLVDSCKKYANMS